MRLILLFIFAFVSFLEVVSLQIEIVSIVDASSSLACLLKVHSIIESARNRKHISLRFVLLPSESLSVASWNNAITGYFPEIFYESKVWRRPANCHTFMTINLKKM